LSLSDATLDIPVLNSGGVVAVKTLTLSGSANTINITAIPAIGSYPATFTLISYQDGYTAGTGPISLGPLPDGYNGALVDAGGGVIQLQLTSGPVTDLTLYWTGATDNNWDSASPNWLFEGDASAFFAGGAVLFDDNTTQSAISINEPVSPSSITFSNNLLPYTFTGVGNIAGASALIKTGAASLTLDNAGVNNIGSVTISEGTLQLGAEDENGGLSAVSIVNNGALVVDRTDSLALSSAISGSGTLTKNGAGTLTLSGANSYGGATTVNGGTLEIDGVSSGAGALTTAANTVLAGNGTVNGAVTVGGQLNPGAATAPGIFNANNGLTLDSGGTLNFDLSATAPSDPAQNDSINVTGDLHVNDNTITVNFNGTPQPGASYLLFTYTGTLSGSFNPTVLGTHFAATLDTSAPGFVYLNVTGATGAALEWGSFSDSTWDSITTNWTDLSSGQPSVFYAGDSILLDDSNGVLPTLTLAAGVSVAPSLITNDSTNNYFTISGAGSITGGASIVKAGPSTLVISTANSFSGPVDVQGGTLQTGNGAALGSAAAGTTVEPGATLDLNGQILGGEVITISSNGVNGAGALVNNGPGQAQALRQIVLAGDATIGGTGLIGINNGGGAAGLSTGGQPFSLTKVGANQLTLQNFTTIDPALANVDIQQGTIEFSGLTASMGDPAYTNTVEAGATLSLSQNTVAWNKQFVFNGDGATTTLNIGTSANAELDGPVVLHGNCVFNVGGTMLTFANTISGDGGVIKNGGSPMIFTMPCTYTGDTVLNSAALRLNGSADISSSPNITINAGSTLTVTGLVDSTFTLAGSQTLMGNGVVNGKLITSAGSTLSPGVSGVGMLTVSNAVTLGGTTVMELDPDNATNDVLKSGGSIAFGGTLNLVNLGASLPGGSSFKLFNAVSYTGSFTINPPTPGPGQTWDTSDLLASGTIKVVGGGTTGPQFGGTVVADGNVIFSGSGGAAFGTYYVLAATNVALPLSSWTPIATNQFDANGNFTFTNSLDSSVPQQFFQLQLP
jgi:fibronectin-binding autotransporter adhesin